MQERYNSSVLAMELCLSCINPSECLWIYIKDIPYFTLTSQLWYVNHECFVEKL